MRFIAVDWGTSRVRVYLVAGGEVVAAAAADDGIGGLRTGDHPAVFDRLCGDWLGAEPILPVILVGMVGSREGWFPAPYVECPAGAAEIASTLLAVDLGRGRRGFVVPGLVAQAGHRVDVMRGEETHLFGCGVADGLVCLPGTHCKWAELRDGRVTRFATFMTGEMHALLRTHSMIGRPATEPADPDGFAAGLDASADGGGLLHQLFGARAATVTGRLAPAALGPFLSGLLTGAEIAGARATFGLPGHVTIVADDPRAQLYVQALAREGVATSTVGQDATLLGGLARILAARADPSVGIGSHHGSEPMP